MDTTTYTATCTRCGRSRPSDQHPCPGCRNPEYSLPKAAMVEPARPAKAARKSGIDRRVITAKELEPDPPREPLPGQRELFPATPEAPKC